VHTSSGQSKSVLVSTQCPTCAEGGRLERCLQQSGRQKFCLELEARFPLGLSNALETRTRAQFAGQIRAGKKAQCREKGKAALISFLRRMR